MTHDNPGADGAADAPDSHPHEGRHEVPRDLDVVTVTWRHPWVVIGVALAVIVVTLALSLTRSPTYSSQARVLVKPIAPTSDVASIFLYPVNIASEQAIASSIGIASQVKRNLGLQQSATSLLDGLRVSTENQSLVLDFDYTDTSAAQAQKLAAAFASAYMANRAQQATTQAQKSAATLTAQMRILDSEIAAITTQMRAAAPRDMVGLTTRLETLATQRGMMQQQVFQLQQTEKANATPSQLIAPADLPAGKSGRQHLTQALLGLVIGLALGVGVAYVMETAEGRRRVRAAAPPGTA
jgi:uncharacterized protein involved in exopolysaccharide biosynthesis